MIRQKNELETSGEKVDMCGRFDRHNARLANYRGESVLYRQRH